MKRRWLLIDEDVGGPMLLHFDEVRSAYPDPVDEDWVHVRTADGSVLRIRIPFEEFVVQLTRGEGL